MEEMIIGKVARIEDPFTIVINKGTKDGIKIGQKFLVYRLGEVIVDPDTKEELGTLEVICGEGEVASVQEKMATLKSSAYKQSQIKRTRQINPLSSLWGNEVIYETEKENIPFENVSIGCLFKRIN